MALHGKKAPSASQTRRVSRRVNDSMIGSHVERGSSARGRHAAGADRPARVDFSDGRRSRRADRGMVDQVDVGATSGESDSDYARRRARRSYAEEIQAKGRRRKMIFFGAVALLVVVDGRCGGHGGVLRLVRLPAVLGRLERQRALTAPEEGAPYYALLSAISPRTRQLPPHLTRPTSPCASTRAPARLLSSRCRPRCPWSFPTASATPSATPRRLAATRSFSGPPVRCSGFSSPTLPPPMPKASPPWLIWWEACRWSCPRKWTTPGPHPTCCRRLPDA